MLYCITNRKSAAKFRTGKGSKTIPFKGSRVQANGIRSGGLTIQNDCDEDIVCTQLKG